MKVLVALLALCALSNQCFGAIPTTTDLANARAAIRQLIVDNEDNAEGFVNIPGFVRLSFHDCVGDGGCDGCVDHTDSHNAGLLKYTDALETIYPNFETKMSRADFWMLAAVEALTNATEHVDDKFEVSDETEFKVGRIDCGSHPLETAKGNFPSAFYNYDEMEQYFADEFGFTSREMVALMGAHTLGRARAEDSGFEGRWVPGRLTDGIRHTDVLDNTYYFNLRGKWIQKSVVDPSGNSKLQWQRDGFDANTYDNTNAANQSSMYMNSDLAISWQFENSTVYGDGSISCTIEIQGNCRTSKTCCSKAASVEDFEAFTNDNALWLGEFKAVFLKMIERNTAGLVTATSEAKRDEIRRMRDPSRKKDEKSNVDVKPILDKIQEDLEEIENIMEDEPKSARFHPKFGHKHN